jgi:sulfate permease, SulP family
VLLKRLRLFMSPFGDGRYEDLSRGNYGLNILRDLTAGLIVAMVAIPLAMGFAMASGLRPEQGIVGGAVAGLVGALFGGSKYQVYGPTAAFIPIIAGIMAAHGHAFLVLASMVAGVLLMGMGVTGFGKYVKLVPHSIVVGFTIGIAATIALSQATEVFGFQKALPYALLPKIAGIAEQFGTMNLFAVVIAIGTVVVTKTCLRVSVFLPGPLVALGLFTLLAATLLDDAGLTLVRTKYGEIPSKSWIFTPPETPIFSGAYLGDLLYAAVAIVFVAAIESLLCSRMADRLANNKGVPYNPDKELWGQGLVSVFVVLFNGFPHTGALARTATNIKLGALSPLAGIAKFAFKLALAFYLASWLELVPMACIGGILLYVAMNMVKKEEVTEVLHLGRGHTLLMVYTAVMVIGTDFLTGVLSALAIYVIWQRFFAGASMPTAADAAAHAVLPKDIARAPSTMRARIAGDSARRPSHLPGAADLDEGPLWRRHISRPAVVPRTAFVHPQATLIGRVVLGDDVHVAAGTSVRADEGAPFFIGPSTNVQDGVIIHALKHRFVEVAGEDWAVFVGRNVSIAHGAIVHGPCYIGDDTFIGFQATVHDSIVGRGCFIGHGALVVGVEVPDRKHVPNGAIIDTADKVALLPDATDQHAHFNEDVVEVNRGLAAAYRRANNDPRTATPNPALFLPSPGARAQDRF